MKIEDCTSQNNQDYSCIALLKAMEDTVYAIGGKWKLRIIIALSEKPVRFNELQRLLGKISPRVLSNELKDLEQNGFINRKVNSSATPILVEYELAEYSKSLKPVIQTMVSWGISHREKVKAS
jgi:DNA-binding HxlR family transcriptional regulator